MKKNEILEAWKELRNTAAVVDIVHLGINHPLCSEYYYSNNNCYGCPLSAFGLNKGCKMMKTREAVLKEIWNNASDNPANEGMTTSTFWEIHEKMKNYFCVLNLVAFYDDGLKSLEAMERKDFTPKKLAFLKDLDTKYSDLTIKQEMDKRRSLAEIRHKKEPKEQFTVTVTGQDDEYVYGTWGKFAVKIYKTFTYTGEKEIVFWGHKVQALFDGGKNYKIYHAGVESGE
ncbi:MAG: hypothetical protein GY757_10050 [bacterium]|nr:hypothetical protein [bacterium]